MWDDLEFSFFWSLSLSLSLVGNIFGEKGKGLRWEGRERAQISGSKQKVDWLVCWRSVCPPRRPSAQPRRMKKGCGSSGSWAEAWKSNIGSVRVTNNEDDAFFSLARVFDAEGRLYWNLFGWEGREAQLVASCVFDHDHVFLWFVVVLYVSVE
jgi:hypothetical protein